MSEGIYARAGLPGLPRLRPSLGPRLVLSPPGFQLELLEHFLESALTTYRMALEIHLENVKAARARQSTLKEGYRQATREVRQMAFAGADEVRRLRSRVKAELGPRDARLRLFGIKPL